MKIDDILDTLSSDNCIDILKLCDKNILEQYKKEIYIELIKNNYYKILNSIQLLIDIDNNQLVNLIICNFNYFNISFLNWLIEHKPKLLINIIDKIFNKNKFILYKKEKLFIENIYNFVINIEHIEPKYLLTFKLLINSTITCNYLYSIDDIDVIIWFVIQFKKENNLINYINVYRNAIIIMIKNNTTLNILLKSINKLEIKQQELHDILTLNDTIFKKVCSNGDLQVLNWYIENSSLCLIKSSNFKNIFICACESYNPIVAKIVYNLIICSGYSFDKLSIQYVTTYIMQQLKWNNKNLKLEPDLLIYELINLGAKPPFGSEFKYIDYYNNISFL